MQGINNRMKKSTFFSECSKDSWIEKQNPEDQNSRNKGIPKEPGRGKGEKLAQNQGGDKSCQQLPCLTVRSACDSGKPEPGLFQIQSDGKPDTGTRRFDAVSGVPDVQTAQAEQKAGVQQNGQCAEGQNE